MCVRDYIWEIDTNVCPGIRPIEGSRQDGFAGKHNDIN